MVDWPQLAWYILGICGTLITAIALYYTRRVESHEKLLAGLAIINNLLQKHDIRLDAIDLSILHIREFAHDTRNLLPSAFEKQEMDRRRSETAENFRQLFAKLDQMQRERFEYQQRILELLATKQDKVP